MRRWESAVQMLRYTEDANDGILTDKTHYLMLYAMTHMVQPQVAVEIGSRRAGSAIWIARALAELEALEGSRGQLIKPGHLYCIDPFVASHGGAPSFIIHFEHNLEEIGLRDYVTLLKMRSDDPEISPNLPDEIDLLFIDGDHSYEGACHDIERFVPHVQSGGAVLIHDSLCEDGVKRAIKDCANLLVPYVDFTMENRNGMWIGVKI